ncbi:hypothetical protein RHGRI_000430 [Rhododendron griersonianum]|uniref:Uncharacterized protein n=1 Tax=Rhododendron griersonianum TaxID=479676 RepID=A0AAV6LHI9_9ERIC|nr:hypothetical protein RHGRI_000430 [Rhododendron griersonianum]
MRPYFLLSVLLLSTIISEEGRTVNKASDGAIDGEDIQCKEGQCSSGKNRKLIAKATSTNPTTISKNETNGGKLSTDVLGGKRESFSVDSLPDSNHREATRERYPDTLDIDEMDYSPARRKPPIHN